MILINHKGYTSGVEENYLSVPYLILKCLNYYYMAFTNKIVFPKFS